MAMRRQEQSRSLPRSKASSTSTRAIASSMGKDGNRINIPYYSHAGPKHASRLIPPKIYYPTKEGNVQPFILHPPSFSTPQPALTPLFRRHYDTDTALSTNSGALASPTC